jgi:hypothetical protein
MPIMIEFPTNTTDNSDYVQNVSTVISDRVSKWKPSDLFITKIDNWFDDKWVKFSGTIMHEISVWREEVTVPPFHPNRVDSSEFYKLEKGDYLKQENKKPLHIRQTSTQNIKREITDFSKDGLFIWYSGNTKTNDKGSVMGYLVKENDCFIFYL